MRRSLGLAVVLALAGVATSQARQTPIPAHVRAAADRINAAQLARDLGFLSSDELRGRNTPSPGFDAAARYVADRLRRAGLKPAGDNGTFFQHYTLREATVDTDNSTIDIDGRRLRFGGDFVLRSFAGPLTGTFRMVYVGHGWVVPDKGIDPYAGVDVRGKVLLVHGPRALPKGVELPQIGRITPGASSVFAEAEKRGAAGIIFLPQASALGNWEQMRRQNTRLRELEPRVPSAYAAQPVTSLLLSRAAADAVLARETNGASIMVRGEAREYAGSFELSRPIVLAITAATSIAHRPYNVVAILEGSDPVLKAEHITVFAHLDGAVGTRAVEGDDIYNSADDNASGSAGTLSIAEHMAAARPKRSIVFVWDSGEEQGLWGTRQFVANPPIPLARIVAHFNIDMIGATRAPGSADEGDSRVTGPNETYLIGPGVLSPRADALLERVNAAYLKMTFNRVFDRPESEFFYPRTDAGPFLERGILTIGFTTGIHRRYHGPADEARFLDPQKIEAIARTAFVSIWALADSAERPSIERPIPSTVPNHAAPRQARQPPPQPARAQQPPALQPPARADILRGEYGRYRANNDLLFYHLDVRVDPDRKRVSGKNTIRFRMLKDDTRIQLDLYPNMTIERIVLGAVPLKYHRELNAVFIDFPETLKAGREYSIEFHYSGTPTQTGRFGGFSFGKDPAGNPWIVTANEGQGASLWWPNKDQWRDEPSNMDLSVAIPNDLVDVSNGRFLGKTDLGDGYTRWDWRVHYPINSYNVSLNIGKYAHFGEKHPSTGSGQADLTLDYYVLPPNLEKARRQFAQVKPMLEAWEKIFGEYPFKKDGYKLIEVPYSGMEHQSAVTYGNRFANGYLERDWTGVGVSLKFDFIIIHESAHEWFGNAVSAADVSDMWIQEGWATYLENLYVEHVFGYDDALKYVNGYKSKVRNREPIITQRGIHRSPSQDQYFKGALFLNTLRSVVNDDVRWWKLLRDFYQRFKYQNILTEDMVAFFNAQLGRDLTPIFDQYLRRSALPVLELAFNDAEGTLAYRWKADEARFAMPVRVGKPGAWQIITPTTSWQLMKAPMAKDDLDVATELYYVDVVKQ